MGAPQVVPRHGPERCPQRLQKPQELGRVRGPRAPRRGALAAQHGVGGHGEALLARLQVLAPAWCLVESAVEGLEVEGC